jgi:beta-glucosidase
MSLDIDALLDELTLEEKASLTSGSSFWHTQPVDRLGIPKIMVSDGPHGLRAQPGEVDHVGLSGSVPATCFPTASAIASSWNPELLRRVGEALAQEARAASLSVILGPGINMKRSPLCCRNFEYFSEDPYLTGNWASESPTASSPTGSAPRSSTTRPTTRRPTGCASTHRSTSGRCARSTCRRSSGS